MKEIVKTESIKLILSAIVGAGLLLLGQIGLQLLPFYESLKQAISKDLLALLTLIFFLLFLVCLIALRYITAKKLKYGIYWDKQKNPFCPVCKTTIGHLGKSSSPGFFLTCDKCKEQPYLNHESEQYNTVKELIDSI